MSPLRIYLSVIGLTALATLAIGAILLFWWWVSGGAVWGGIAFILTILFVVPLPILFMDR